jgi:hypothetical protein
LDPTLDNEQVKQIILNSADDVNYETQPGRDDELGYGRLNAFKALLRTPADKQLNSNLTIRKSLYGEHPPYYLIGKLVVPDGITLTIETGVKLVFAPGAQVIVEQGGRVVAASNDVDQPIRFVAEGQFMEQPWGLIEFRSQGNTFTNCQFENARTAIRALWNSSVTVNNCTFNNCGTAVMGFYDAQVTMDNCVVNSWGGNYGVVSWARNLTMTNCELYGASRAGIRVVGTSTGLLDEC